MSFENSSFYKSAVIFSECFECIENIEPEFICCHFLKCMNAIGAIFEETLQIKIFEKYFSFSGFSYVEFEPTKCQSNAPFLYFSL